MGALSLFTQEQFGFCSHISSNSLHFISFPHIFKSDLVFRCLNNLNTTENTETEHCYLLGYISEYKSQDIYFEEAGNDDDGQTSTPQVFETE